MADDTYMGEDEDQVGDDARPTEPSLPQQPEDQYEKLMRWADPSTINIADDIDDSTLASIGHRVKHEYDIDVTSRADWMEKTKQAMKLAMQDSEMKMYPWPKASNVIYPLMTTASVQFAARAYPAIISGRSVVKGVVYGSDEGTPAINPQTGQPMVNPQTGQPVWAEPPGMKAARAQKIGEHMSWQLLEEMPEWEPDTDKMLHQLPIIGCAFRKTYFDSSKGRNCSLLVSSVKVVINYKAKSVETAPRVTEEVSLYPLEIEENERAGMFLPIQYSAPPSSDGDEDAPHEFLESHRYYDLDGDGYPEPYVITIHKESSKVVRIVARYDAHGVKIRNGKVIKIDPIHYYTKYDFLPNPDGGIYVVGFGQLLRPINEAVNTSINMLIDAGHLANTGGGFIGRGLSMHTGSVRFTPGEYKSVNVTGAAIKDSVVPLQFPGPSPTLFQLLGSLIEAGKDIASVKDVLTGEQKDSNIPATTTLALIEQGLKVFTAIYKRVYRSLKQELDKLHRLNSLYLDDVTSYRINNTWSSISIEDYRQGGGVEPVSDPSMVSDMQRLGRAQFLLGFASDPFFNGMEIRKRVLNAAQIEKPESLLVPPSPDPKTVESGLRLEINAERTRAEAIKDYSQAILYLSQAMAVDNGQDAKWVESQLEYIKFQLEAMKNEEGNGDQSAPVPDVKEQPGNKD